MQKPVITVLEEGRIQSVGDFARLDFIDWRRHESYWRSSQHAMDTLSTFFINRASYVILQTNLCAYPERDDFPAWKHVGGAHTELGQAFWNFFHSVYDGDLHFSDSPDFSGVIRHKDRKPQNWRVYGDIGKVSPVAVREVISALRYYSLWISVVNLDTLVIVEPLIPVTELDPDTFHWQSLASEEYGKVIPIQGRRHD